jgi:photosystem II stability/assembly factor-like uncharacterized protein
MKHIILFLSFLLFNDNCISQLIPEGWFQQSSPVTSNLNSVYFVNYLNGWSVGNNGIILHTLNGGVNWVQQESNLTTDLEKVFFSSSFTGYIIGNTGTILKTTNGGANWNKQNSGTINNLTSCSFTNDIIGYITGVNNTLLKTTDGGMNWYSINSLDSTNYYSVYFINNSTGWFSSVKLYLESDSAYIYRTTNGGENWYVQHSRKMDIGPNLSLQFTDSLNGWCTWQIPTISGSNILKTTNEGNIWEDKYGGFISENYNLFFINNFKGWACGPFNKIYRTVNGGLNWILSNSFGSVGYYKSIYFTDSLIGWTVGEKGIILKTTTGGVLTGFSNTSDEISDNYSLSQNYPNPFNPNTIINYKCSMFNYISLKVYDILGNEVATLINENKPAGSYDVQFNGSDYPSGIYFYSLIIDGNVADTKRMVLLK